ncbi:MAG: anhydro-N-acetylmuramic acid kinase [Gammaproteobacteria bacterium]
MIDNKLYIGILSGTSMDSIDCGIYSFHNSAFKEIAFYENDYPKNLKNEIIKNLETIKENYIKNEINTNLSNEYSKIINRVLKKENIKAEDIEAIGMHGQTISHLKYDNKNISIQLGSPNVFAKNTMIKVVSDFRNHDIENGGEGAPLAPLFHDYVFKEDKKKRIIVNIGGISNISLLKNSHNDKVRGHDTGPGNTLIDSWMKNNYNKNFDENGNIASKYRVDDNLLNIFLKDNYFKKLGPKSTTTEYFCYDWILEKIKSKKILLGKGDVLATLTALTAISIINSIKDNYSVCDEIFVCGGGAFNKTLISNIKESAEEIFQNEILVDTTKTLGLNPKSVEAGLFAWLAMCKINKIKLNYTEVTGAKEPCILGQVYNIK